MASDWLSIRVELLGGRDVECDPPPGRVMLVGPGHSFDDLGRAIDAAYARWDPGHLSEFELADGRRIGYADAEDAEVLDHANVYPARELEPGDEFAYVFDLGDDWRHRCRVGERVDPEEAAGDLPGAPVPIDGWGWIPDQYGREAEDAD